MKGLGLTWYHQKEKETLNCGSDPEWCASSEAGKCPLETIWKRSYSWIEILSVLLRTLKNQMELVWLRLLSYKMVRTDKSVYFRVSPLWKKLFKVNSETVVLSQNFTPICFLHVSFVNTRLSHGTLYALVPKSEQTQHWPGNSVTQQEFLKKEEMFKPHTEYISTTSISWVKEPTLMAENSVKARRKKN